MAKWSVELRGKITRDIRWIEVEADSLEAAKSKAQWSNDLYEVQAVSKVEPPKIDDSHGLGWSINSAIKAPLRRV